MKNKIKSPLALKIRFQNNGVCGYHTTQSPNIACILSYKNVVKVIAIDIIDVPQTTVAVDLPQCYTRKF